jgi:ribosomal protein S3
MGQKTSPISLRLKQRLNSESKWFLQENYSEGLHNDIIIRDYITNFLLDKPVLPVQVYLKRKHNCVDTYIYLYSLSKEGVDSLIDSNTLEILKKTITGLVGTSALVYIIDVRAFFPTKLKNSKHKFKLPKSYLRSLRRRKRMMGRFRQYKNRPYFNKTFSILNASIMSKNVEILSNFIAQQLEKDFKHNMFLDFINKVIQEHVSFYPLLEGIRVQIKGRVNGAERYRKENFQSGAISLQTIENEVKFCYKPVYTIYGVCGLKIWFCFKK